MAAGLIALATVAGAAIAAVAAFPTSIGKA
jgi:hypothetical protein